MYRKKMKQYRKLRERYKYKYDKSSGLIAVQDLSARLKMLLDEKSKTFEDVPSMSLNELRKLWRTVDRRVDSVLAAAIRAEKRSGTGGAS